MYSLLVWCSFLIPSSVFPSIDDSLLPLPLVFDCSVRYSVPPERRRHPQDRLGTGEQPTSPWQDNLVQILFWYFPNTECNRAYLFFPVVLGVVGGGGRAASAFSRHCSCTQCQLQRTLTELSPSGCFHLFVCYQAHYIILQKGVRELT